MDCLQGPEGTESTAHYDPHFTSQLIKLVKVCCQEIMDPFHSLKFSVNA